MSDEEINDKFRSLARRALSKKRVEQALAALWQLDAVPGLDAIFKAVQTRK